MNLFKRKSIDKLQKEAFAEDEHSLKRSLTARSLILLGIGAIIGAGIFVIATAYYLDSDRNNNLFCLRLSSQ